MKGIDTTDDSSDVYFEYKPVPEGWDPRTAHLQYAKKYGGAAVSIVQRNDNGPEIQIRRVREKIFEAGDGFLYQTEPIDMSVGED